MVLMDALTHILQTVQLSAKTYVCRGTAGPWNLQFQYRPQGIFHIVTQGQCYLREAGNDRLLHLKTGDGVAFPTGGAHWISDSPDSQALAVQNVVNVKGNEDIFQLKNGNVTAFAADSGPRDNNFAVDFFVKGLGQAGGQGQQCFPGTCRPHQCDEIDIRVH